MKHDDAMTLEEVADRIFHKDRANWNDVLRDEVTGALARDLFARNAKVLAKIQRCVDHGVTPNAWGCPECVREARHRIPALEAELAEWRKAGEVLHHGAACCRKAHRSPPNTRRDWDCDCGPSSTEPPWPFAADEGLPAAPTKDDT